MDGKVELICCSVDGEVRGYLPPNLAGPTVGGGIVEDHALEELYKKKKVRGREGKRREGRGGERRRWGREEEEVEGEGRRRREGGGEGEGRRRGTKGEGGEGEGNEGEGRGWEGRRAGKRGIIMNVSYVGTFTATKEL